MTDVRDPAALARARDQYSLRFRTEQGSAGKDAAAWIDLAQALRASDRGAAREAYAEGARWAVGLRASMATQEVRSLDRILDDMPTASDFGSPTKEEVLAEVFRGSDYQVLKE